LVNSRAGFARTYGMPTLPQADKPSIQELWILWRYRKREHVSTTRSLQFAVILLLVEPHNYQVSL
jgi:hypothetical protein